MNKNYIVVYDFETSSADPQTTQPLSLAALAIDPRTLQIEPNRFETLIRPTEPEKVEPGALRVNKLTMEELTKPVEEGGPPSVDVAWKSFVNYLGQFSSGSSMWGKPIAAGHNILNFDNIITDRMNAKYNGGKKTFHPRDDIDTMKLIFLWTENNPAVEKLGMDYLRDYLGLDAEGAHTAKKDIDDCAKIIIRFLRLHRKIAEKFELAGSFTNWEI